MGIELVEPITDFSRYRFANRFRDSNQKIFFELRNRIKFTNRDDNRLYTVKQGDNLLNIAFRLFGSFTRPAGLWWIIMDFNNIIDPTVELELGTLLVIPSENAAREVLSTVSRSFNLDIQDID